MTQSSDKPTLTYWHVWTDDNGISHQTQCELSDYKKESMGGDADPQWIVPLSGVWYVETMDGTRVEMGPRELSFGGDQNTRADADGNKGHMSGCVGDKPAKLMVIQLKGDDYVAAKPGDFK